MLARALPIFTSLLSLTYLRPILLDIIIVYTINIL